MFEDELNILHISNDIQCFVSQEPCNRAANPFMTFSRKISISPDFAEVFQNSSGRVQLPPQTSPRNVFFMQIV
jgi:hypothetical protein